tara:strand:- start:4805 stop:5029 length:225 start_codon:yes stop_codon:yes gene_type:complete
MRDLLESLDKLSEEVHTFGALDKIIADYAPNNPDIMVQMLMQHLVQDHPNLIPEWEAEFRKNHSPDSPAFKRYR